MIAQSSDTEQKEEKKDFNMNDVFIHLQEILDQVIIENQNRLDAFEFDPYCLAFYDNNGKLW